MEPGVARHLKPSSVGPTRTVRPLLPRFSTDSPVADRIGAICLRPNTEPACSSRAARFVGLPLVPYHWLPKCFHSQDCMIDPSSMKRIAITILAILALAFLSWRALQSNQGVPAAVSIGPKVERQKPPSENLDSTLLSAHEEEAERTIRVQAEVQESPEQPSVLGTKQPLMILVVDTTGHPISGAVAYGSNSRALAPPTDSQGKSELKRAVTGLITLNAIALGYLPGEAPVGVAEEVRITLEKSCKLTVLLESTGPKSELQPQLRLDYTSPLFGDTYAGPLREYRFVDGCTTGNNSGWGAGSGSILFSPQARSATPGFPQNGQRYVLSGLNPGVPFELHVIDAFNHVLATRIEPGMQAKEWRGVRIVAPVAMRPLTGRVLDPNGRPLVVRVGLRVGDTTDAVGTDTLGRFQFPGVGSDSANLIVLHEKYADFSIRVPVPPSGDVGDMTMEYRSELNVFVRDELGAPLRSFVQTVEDLSDQVTAKRISEGHSRFSTLGPGEVEIEIHTGGRKHLRRVAPGETPNLEVVLPVHGALEVTVPEIPGVDPNAFLRVAVIREDTDLEPSGRNVDALPSVIQITPLFPGYVTVRLEVWVADPDYKWVPLTESRAVQIHPGKITPVPLLPL